MPRLHSIGMVTYMILIQEPLQMPYITKLINKMLVKCWFLESQKKIKTPKRVKINCSGVFILVRLEGLEPPRSPTRT